MDEMIDSISIKNPIFRGSKVGIGSFYDGTKKTPANEYDYIWQLNREQETIVLKNKIPPRTSVQDKKSIDFFEVFKGTMEVMNAAQIIDDFHTCVAEYLQEKDESCYIEKNGPAISFYIAKVDGRAFAVNDSVKVDLTLGLPVNIDCDYICDDGQISAKLVGEGSRIGLRTVAFSGIRWSIIRGHLIPYGDLWRLSFALHECQVISEVSQEKKHFLVALKHLRDVNSTTDDFERTPLNSYLMKTAFLHEVMQYPDATDWRRSCLSKRAASVLNAMEEGTLNHWLLYNTPVLSNQYGDRSALEVRKLTQYSKTTIQELFWAYLMSSVALLFTVITATCLKVFRYLFIFAFNMGINCVHTKTLVFLPLPTKTLLILNHFLEDLKILYYRYLYLS